MDVYVSLNAEIFLKKTTYYLKQVTEEIRLGGKKPLANCLNPIYVFCTNMRVFRNPLSSLPPHLSFRNESTPFFIPRGHTNFRSIWHKKMKGLKKIQQENIKAKLRSMPYSNDYKITSNMDFQHLLYMVFYKLMTHI